MIVELPNLTCVECCGPRIGYTAVLVARCLWAGRKGVVDVSVTRHADKRKRATGAERGYYVAHSREAGTGCSGRGDCVSHDFLWYRTLPVRYHIRYGIICLLVPGTYHQHDML